MAYEYKTVGGPERGRRQPGARRVADRVAAAMQEIIDAETAEGWEYMRTDLVAVEERRGFLSRRQTMHCPVMVFRRALPEAAGADGVAQAGAAPRAPAPAAAPAAPQPAPAQQAEPLVLGVAVGQRVDGEGPAPAARAAGALAPSPAPASAARASGGRTLYLRRDGRHTES